jgi:hypothetical protein
MGYAMAQTRVSAPAPVIYAALLVLSVSVLTFEINLTRLFSVSQFYHFAFMVVSLALLGSGASGTFLSIFPRLGRANPAGSLGWVALLGSLAMVGSYLLINGAPFDSFSIAWDRRQALILTVHYIALALPFFFSGMAVSLYLEAYPARRGQIYAANLIGSAVGCGLALVLPALLGGVGVVIFSSGLGALAALGAGLRTERGRQVRLHAARMAVGAALVLLALVDGVMRLTDGPTLTLFDLKLSPYKSLSYALQVPGAEIVQSEWNAFARVDWVTSPGIRSFPGMSYLYMEALPVQEAIFVDGDDLSPVMRPGVDTAFAAYMPAAIAFELRPQADALILEPRGGLDIVVAQSQGAARVTAVEANPLVIEAAGEIYRSPGVQTVVDTDRSYLQRGEQLFDVIVFSHTGAYRPIRSGAYSLMEDYRYTVETFVNALEHLHPDGLLSITSWLQTPPSEELRVFAISVTAVEQLGGDPAAQIAAFRGYNTLTLLVRRSPFTPAELEAVRQFAASRAYDLVYAPGIDPDEVNRYNILQEPVYYRAFTSLLATQPRSDFYEAYPYAVSPPVDDRPFFGHFFKWSQAGQVLAELGRTWQPFGGAGYFVILALLALALVTSAVLILLPLGVVRGRPGTGQASFHLALPVYFGLIGFAYLLVEIPLIQRFILYLGHPAYALAIVLFTLLLFSGLGSRWSHYLPVRITLPVLTVMLVALPLLLPALFRLTLAQPLGVRIGLTVVVLAPVGFLMGTPFPSGLRHFLGESEHSPHLPWIWSINGAASVIAAVLAALLVLSFGFGWVLVIGSGCYVGAGIMAAVFTRSGRGRSPGR